MDVSYSETMDIFFIMELLDLVFSISKSNSFYYQFVLHFGPLHYYKRTNQIDMLRENVKSEDVLVCDLWNNFNEYGTQGGNSSTLKVKPHEV